MPTSNKQQATSNKQQATSNSIDSTVLCQDRFCGKFQKSGTRFCWKCLFYNRHLSDLESKGLQRTYFDFVEINNFKIVLMKNINGIVINPDAEDNLCSRTIKAQYYKNGLVNILHHGSFGCSGVIQVV